MTLQKIRCLKGPRPEHLEPLLEVDRPPRQPGSARSRPDRPGADLFLAAVPVSNPPQPPKQPWWNHPWVYSTGSAVIAGLIVAYAGELKPIWVLIALAAAAA